MYRVNKLSYLAPSLVKQGITIFGKAFYGNGNLLKRWSDLLPIDLHLIFEKSSLKNQVG